MLYAVHAKMLLKWIALSAPTIPLLIHHPCALSVQTIQIRVYVPHVLDSISIITPPSVFPAAILI